MRYMKAADVLPPDLLAQVQAYIDGEYLYIPRRETSRKPWGAANGRKAETLARNQEIYRRYREGTSVDQLAEAYFLAPKSIWKIIARQNRNGAAWTTGRIPAGMYSPAGSAAGR